MSRSSNPHAPDIDWQETRKALLGFVRARFRDEAIAEDIVQDVLSAAFLKSAQLNHRDRLLPWLFAMARNRAIDVYRKRGREQEAVDAFRAEGLVAGEAPLNHGEAEITDMRSQLAACMDAILERQSDRDRDAIRLVDLEDRGQRALAVAHGLSLSGAKSRLQRARRRARETLERCCRTVRDGRGHVVDLVPDQSDRAIDAPTCCGSAPRADCGLSVDSSAV